MNVFKKLATFFSPPPASPFHDLTVRCSRCGEVIQARVNLHNDLSIEYDDSGKALYHVRKVLMGQGRCFQQIEVLLTFTPERRLVERQISGGKFADETEPA